MDAARRMIEPRCRGCDRYPDQIDEYVIRCAQEVGHYNSAADLVRRDEGTYNRVTGRFWCGWCYLQRGMPLGTA